jgi:hypothetical protein
MAIDNLRLTSEIKKIKYCNGEKIFNLNYLNRAKTVNNYKICKKKISKYNLRH